MLVSIINKNQTELEVQENLNELAFLVETAGATTLKRFIQKLPHADTRTYVGKGKLEEIKHFTKSHSVNVIIFDDELSG